MKTRVALIGPGKVGCAVSQRLQRAGYQITSVVSRDLSRAQEACRFIGAADNAATVELTAAATAEIILLAVPDDQLVCRADQLQTVTNLSSEQTLIHFSGLHRAEMMRTCDAGPQLLSIHPLLPFADRQLAAQALIACPCAIEGDPASATLGNQLVIALGGIPFLIDSDKKALYHAAACIASNFLVTLLGTARDLLISCGIAEQQIIPLLLPLVQASLDNVEKLGPEAGLTGPIVRGDVGTVQQHLMALETAAPQLLPLYRLLGEKTVSLAEASGRLQPEQADRLRSPDNF